MIILAQKTTKVVVLSKCLFSSHPPVFYLSFPVDTSLVAINAQGVFHLDENGPRNNLIVTPR